MSITSVGTLMRPVSAGALLRQAWDQIRWQTRPRTRREQAAEVRAMARELRGHDPYFAADLLAAADRHEALGESAP